MISLLVLGLLSLLVAFIATRVMVRWVARLTIIVAFALLAPYLALGLVGAVRGTLRDLISPEVFAFLLIPWLFCFAGGALGIGFGYIGARARP